MDMLKVTAQWSGFTGAPGYSTFYFAGGGGLISDAQQVADRVRGAFDTVKGIFPGSVKVAISPEVSVVDAATGVASAIRTITPGAVVAGSGTGNYSAASGAVVTWRTSDLRFGRRILGRTFLVPLAQGAYDADGTLSAPGMVNLNNFATALRGVDFDSEFGIWSRPRNGSGGVFASVDGHTVRDKVAVLRSRRD